MGNLIHYLKQQGDISLQKSGFNEVDNLILSFLSYLDLDGIVPGDDSVESITVFEAYTTYASRHTWPARPSQNDMFQMVPFALREMALGVRFCNARLSRYINHFSEAEQKQFAALTVELDDGTGYVAFRGTDNHLVSFREDFNMSFQTVPAQIEAVCYLENAMLGIPSDFRLGGHSKGGHLAVYAATMCPTCLKKRIVRIYNNDGPGLGDDLLNSDSYSEIKEKIQRIVPEYGVVGTLFSHKSKMSIVKSRRRGFMQHDCISWEISGCGFIRAEKLDSTAAFVDRVLRNWVNSMSLEERKLLVCSLFDAFEASGLRELSDLTALGPAKVLEVAQKSRLLERKSRSTITALVKSVVGTIAWDFGITRQVRQAQPA